LKKSIHYIVIFLLFCLIEGILYIFYYDRTKNEINDQVNINLEEIEKIYNSAIKQANTSSNNFYYYYLQKNKIIENFINAYYADTQERNSIRKQLQNILINDITKNEKKRIKAVNFIFPDNTVFLRSDFPEKYGDNLSHRQMIALANQNKLRYSGFDVGLTEVSYRYVIPLHDQYNFNGIIELKISVDFFFDYFNTFPSANTFAIISKKFSDNIFLPNTNNYYHSIEGTEFVADSISYHSYIQLMKTLSEDTSQNITEIIKPLIQQNQAQYKYPTRLIRKDSDYYILMLIPITNISDSKLGYYVISTKSEHISNTVANNLYYFIIISIFVLAIFVLYLFRDNYTRKIKKNLQDLQKSKNKLSQTLYELQKYQTELQEKQEFTAQINTLLREHEKELENLLLEKDKFFSILSHDIKNPIGGILTDADMLNLYYEKMSDEDRKSSINRILNSTHNLNKLVKEMLDWGMIRLNRLEVQEEHVTPYDIISKVVSQLSKSAAEKGNQVIIDCPQDLVIISDEDLLSIIFRNILQNSIKFTNNGKIIISCTTNDKNVVFKIKDTGVGIPFENLDKIFKLDKTLTTIGTNGELGTGLGLILVKDYVTKLGGEISINSMEGMGTTVTIILENKIENK